MILIDISVLPEIYLVVFLAAIFVLWIAYKMAGKSNEKYLLRHPLQCPLCGMKFEDNSSALLPQCPQCGSLNERDYLKTRYY